MNIIFWGSRGSLPFSLTTDKIEEKIFTAIKEAQKFSLESDSEIHKFIHNKLPFSVRSTFGSNTSCVEIRHGNENIICDAGSGIRDFGNYYMRSGKIARNEASKTFHIFMSHLHWDHLQGFPFFVPIYIPGIKINIYSCHKEVEKAFVQQQEPPFFPVSFRELKSDIIFHQIEPGQQLNIDGLSVEAIKQNHPGDSYGFKFESGEKKFVYSTDSEHYADSEVEEYPYIQFIKNADILVFDAQYSLRDAIDTKLNWGHSSNLTAVELAVRANVKKLILFHSEHTFDDTQLEDFLKATRKYRLIHDPDSQLEIDTAYDGMSIKI